MKQIGLLSIAVGLIFLVACNKDQKVVKQLEGTWESVTVDGVTVPDSAKTQLTFVNCKLKKDETCDITTTFPDGSSETQQYRVDGDGTQLVVQVEIAALGLSLELTSTIDELTDSKLVLTTAVDTVSTTTEYQKK